MQEIKPTYISFEQAKWLKEKGFDEKCSHSYKQVEPVILYQHQDKKYNNSFKKEWQNTVRKNSHMDNAVINRYSAPEQHIVVEWLRVNHGIWISVDIGEEYWFWKIRGINGKIIVKEQIPDELCTTLTDLLFSNTEYLKYNSPQEAYSAAFDYIISNQLI